MNETILHLKQRTNSCSRRRSWVAGGTVAPLFILALSLIGCSPRPTRTWQGYIEGEFVYISAGIPGTLISLKVDRGMNVKTVQAVFELDHEPELAAQRESAGRLQQALDRLENLKKGQRPSEIEAIQARLARARAALKLSETEFHRREILLAKAVISKAEFDEGQSALERDQAQVRETAAELETAQLGARVDEIRAAEADIAALRGTLAQIDWRVKQTYQAAPSEGLIYDTLYREGEWVAAGSPVVAMLPPQNIKVRFFVPETRIAQLKMGQALKVHLDGLTEQLHARITFISPQAEFTPPVIYSRENRAKLVFMVEGTFDQAQPSLRPGQPVDVTL